MRGWLLGLAGLSLAARSPAETAVAPEPPLVQTVEVAPPDPSTTAGTEQMPTLRHIALFCQDQIRVKHDERTDEGCGLDVPVLRPIVDRGEARRVRLRPRAPRTEKRRPIGPALFNSLSPRLSAGR